MGDDPVLRLLQEIRDTQRAQMEEYRKAAAHAAEVEQEVRGRQQKATRIARRLALVSGVMILALLTLLVVLLARWWRYLFPS